jgi:hypothetical protein
MTTEQRTLLRQCLYAFNAIPNKKFDGFTTYDLAARITSALKTYVPYGINGLYYVYDNEENRIPLGYGNKTGTKKEIQTLCDELNNQL